MILKKKIYVQELNLDLFDFNKKTNYIYNEIYIKYIETIIFYILIINIKH